MNLIESLSEKWKDINHPFLIHPTLELRFGDLTSQEYVDLSEIKKGDVVALIGDFDPNSILTFLRLVDLGTIIVPLTRATSNQHDYFFESSLVNVVIEGGNIRRRNQRKKNALLEKIRLKKHSGLVLFSTGTTGKPKAILHDLSLFLKRFETPRPSLVTLNFLLFDHIGGLNTLLHTLFNKGVVIVPPDRTPESILETCSKYKVEVLPATPTFLRIMLLSGLVPEKVPESLKIITYGTEMMDQHTLKELCNLLPKVDFRQTYGMSELGIVRVKSKARDSLYMKIGGEGIQTRVVDNVLQIKSNTRMIGYLNSSSPFGKGGWYDTKDIVQEKEDFIKITGRSSDVVNVGGLKFMTSDVERVALNFPNVRFVKALSRKNPITGEHIEIIVEPKEEKKFKLKDYKLFLKESLEAHMVPRRITVDKISIGHRFKKL